jgi:hypothetical protein
MPCYHCGSRQTDPARGASPWKRGVRGGVQVLVCPTCQESHNWSADLDWCARCRSTMLVRVLGETRCRACGAVAASGPPHVKPVAAPPVTDLSAEVAAALERLFAHRAGADI